MADQSQTTKWRTRDEAPPAGPIWVSDGKEVWILMQWPGGPFDAAQSACLFWMPAQVPGPPDAG